MAKDFAMRFYNSKAWRNCRKAYMAKAGGLCEICLAKGIIKPGEIVHHKVHLTPSNIDNPAITLSFDNLQLVCRECKAKDDCTRTCKEYKIWRRVYLGGVHGT